MIRVHKIALKLNNKQITYCKKSAGVARFAYNWALANWKEQYALGEKPSETKLRRQLNAIKKDQFPWMLEVTKVAPQQAIKNLGNAFNRFFKKTGQYPKFKKKGCGDSFRADNGPAKKGENAAKIKDRKIQLPIIGWLTLKEKLRFTGQIKSIVISRTADQWFAAISIEMQESQNLCKNHATVGVDLGIKAFATLSTGEVIIGPRAHTKKLKKLKRISRSLSNKKKGSNNFKKAKIRLARFHKSIKNIRLDAIHKATTYIVKNHKNICIEDLNVRGMVKNKKLSRHIMDQSFYEVRRQLEYKCEWYDSNLLIADRFFASSKLCHVCDTKNELLTLSVRDWICVNCEAHHDRDINAAVNLKNYFIKTNTVSSTGIYACEEKGADAVEINCVKPRLVETRIQH